MRTKHTVRNVKKHRGNPHGNAPEPMLNQKKEDDLRSGVSKAPRRKQ